MGNETPCTFVALSQEKAMKNYQRGEPSSVLYVKNLAKTIGMNDLSAVFGSVLPATVDPEYVLSPLCLWFGNQTHEPTVCWMTQRTQHPPFHRRENEVPGIRRVPIHRASNQRSRADPWSVGAREASGCGTYHSHLVPSSAPIEFVFPLLSKVLSQTHSTDLGGSLVHQRVILA